MLHLTSLPFCFLQGPPKAEDSDCDSTDLDPSSGEALRPPASLPP